MERYYLTTDNDSHWLIVPVNKRKEFEEWLDISSDDERSWEYPDYVKEVGGCPSMVTFFDPQIN